MTTTHDTLPALAVLVADDHPVNQLVAQSLLEKLGQVVTVVENGVEALARCREQQFDLVLLDIQMPEMDGITACWRIRREVAAERLPHVLAISADAFAPSDDRFRVAGFHGALVKPFRVDDVVQAIRAAAAAAAGRQRQ